MFRKMVVLLMGALLLSAVGSVLAAELQIDNFDDIANSDYVQPASESDVPDSLEFDMDEWEGFDAADMVPEKKEEPAAVASSIEDAELLSETSTLRIFRLFLN